MITRDDWLKAMQDALQQQPAADGFTVAELVAQAGLTNNDHSRAKIRHFLRTEIAAGNVIGQMGRRPSITGHLVAVPVYVPTKTT